MYIKSMCIAVLLSGCSLQYDPMTQACTLQFNPSEDQIKALGEGCGIILERLGSTESVTDVPITDDILEDDQVESP